MDIENKTKTALLHMRGKALNDIKLADLALKKATKNHRSDVLTIKKRIADINRNIKICDNGDMSKISIPIRRRGRPKGSVNKVKNGNPKTLTIVILEILKRNKCGLTLSKIVIEIVKTGYKSNTKDDFSKIVYQNLYNLQKLNKVVKDKSKNYRII